MNERRLHPRINMNLPLNVGANGYDFCTNTQNVSCLGTYCHITKYVPPFTRVRIKMALPMKDTAVPVNVECDGVIVRTDDEPQGGFNVAIYFNRIKDTQRQKLSDYVKQFCV